MALPDARITAHQPADLDAIVAAFEDHFDYLCRALRRLGVDARHVEDLAQDVFVVMCRRWGDYQPDRPLRPWLMGIAFRVAQRHRARTVRETPALEPDCEDDSASLDERVDRARTLRLVLSALDRLPTRDRSVVVLHALEGMSMHDVAALLSIPLFTAYSRLRRARKRCAQAIEAPRGR
jgi:RNA polymerase sigma-70 factor (ECF subfamily)